MRFCLGGTRTRWLSGRRESRCTGTMTRKFVLTPLVVYAQDRDYLLASDILSLSFHPVIHPSSPLFRSSKPTPKPSRPSIRVKRRAPSHSSTSPLPSFTRKVARRTHRRASLGTSPISKRRERSSTKPSRCPTRRSTSSPRRGASGRRWS
jgi:hypothetical protein